MTDDLNEPRHPIRVAAERTGLSPPLLRMWERRYGVVDPARSEGGQRLYSDAEIDRLRLLRRATLGGRSIGQVEELSNEALLELVREDERSRARVPRREEAPGVAGALEEATAAALALDEDELERILRRALGNAGLPTFLEEVGTPLLEDVGERWRAGEAGLAEEHLASAVVRRVAESAMLSLTAPPDAPILVVATPAGERHEMGALLAAATARSAGWRVRYLGPDLPADEIAGAAERTDARAVGLSTVYGAGEEALLAEVEELRKRLAPHVTLLVGGAGALRCRDALADRGAVPVDDLDALRAALPDLQGVGG